jgi:hypothetical protein
MQTLSTIGAALSAVLLATAAHAAGTVNVSFVQPQNFTDVKDRHLSPDRHLEALKRHLEQAAAPYVADGQTLKIEVLDVDLAGEVKPSARANDLRVLKGGADWPRIQLRYALESPGQATRSGEARMQDMAYLMHHAHLSGGDALAYERRMLDDWFKAEFRK